ncbi:hypothetical protein V1517DRAFT_329639 [Lipomyces orientalis]|uniref:Uncharacterized protein n=1 Tax=Lipomyces orientalis TaxID=1233043 RepID=A0ACC3TH96_9ASCO
MLISYLLAVILAIICLAIAQSEWVPPSSDVVRANFMNDTWMEEYVRNNTRYNRARRSAGHDVSNFYRTPSTVVQNGGDNNQNNEITPRYNETSALHRLHDRSTI